MTEWDDQGRPAVWVTVTEPEFDANERDSWDALAEWREARCVQCGNLKVICHDPDGLHGEGYYPTRDVCHVTRVRMAAAWMWEQKHKGVKPDAQGFHPTDGTLIWAALTEQNPEDDFLGLGPAGAGGLDEADQQQQDPDPPGALGQRAG